MKLIRELGPRASLDLSTAPAKAKTQSAKIVLLAAATSDKSVSRAPSWTDVIWTRDNAFRVKRPPEQQFYTRDGNQGRETRWKQPSIREFFFCRDKVVFEGRTKTQHTIEWSSFISVMACPFREKNLPDSVCSRLCAFIFNFLLKSRVPTLGSTGPKRACIGRPCAFYFFLFAHYVDFFEKKKNS